MAQSVNGRERHLNCGCFCTTALLLQALQIQLLVSQALLSSFHQVCQSQPPPMPPQILNHSPDGKPPHEPAAILLAIDTLATFKS